ncbi:UPF0488 protein CG14286 [Tribolium madens]|uniref:UPF0488 protein CG14286 n=1 Tax=Tribolium madens TaxID=41895 RepID=UPI001CF7617E|nr:UPF0488 protein CG14286 [Tribolium madens]
MPPKPKLHKNKGKSDLKISPSPNTETPPESSNIATNPELQEQFESELCWCIQQLQRSINSGKLNQKQVLESTKVLNMLMNNTTPFIKKRQLMRVTFGDYRAKMLEENKKMSKAINIKISPASPSKKSKFVKKSIFSSSDTNFKFNFDVENVEDNLSGNINRIELNTDSENKSSEAFHFKTSDNSFKFNFVTDES